MKAANNLQLYVHCSSQISAFPVRFWHQAVHRLDRAPLQDVRHLSESLGIAPQTGTAVASGENYVTKDEAYQNYGSADCANPQHG